MAIAQIELDESDIFGLDRLRKVGNILHGEHTENKIGTDEVYLGKQLPLRLQKTAQS